tara:strand:+ start:74 stop:487 length:414 start_codon:yes stop_codon:yes gene_type:complete
MKTSATEESIVKYYKVLKNLHLILTNTSRISMLEFSTRNNVTKNLSTVLQKGGIIELSKSGRSPEWKWTSIEPTREMAIKVHIELSKLNPPRKESRGGKREGAGRKTKELENRYLDSITFKIFWTTIKINLNYKTIK